MSISSEMFSEIIRKKEAEIERLRAALKRIAVLARRNKANLDEIYEAATTALKPSK